MPKVKTINETIRARLRGVEHERAAIQALIDDAGPRGLDPETLIAMDNQMADYAAKLDLMLSIQDPRDTDAWRHSDEGRALERRRRQWMDERKRRR